MYICVCVCLERISLSIRKGRTIHNNERMY